MSWPIAIVLSFSLHAGGSSGRAAAPADPWIGPDKVKHFFLSSFVQSVSYAGLRATGAGHRSSIVGATAVTVTVGLGKELHDRRAGGRFSVRDLAWDVAGAGAATLVLSQTER